MDEEHFNFIKTMLIGTAVAIGVYFTIDYVYSHLDELTVPVKETQQQLYDSGIKDGYKTDLRIE